MPFIATNAGAFFSSRINSNSASLPVWYLSDDVCALADSERHLGHAIQKGKFWMAYDAVHPNALNDGFLFLGRFRTVCEAMEAIQASVGVFERLMARVTAESPKFLM